MRDFDPARRLAVRGLIILLVAGAVLLSARYLGRRATCAISMPIDLRPGVTRSHNFHADYDVDYEVGLEVDRALPIAKLRCALGDTLTALSAAEGAPKNCKRPSPLDLEWKVFSDGRIVAHGATAPGQTGSYGRTVTRNMGVAGLRPGRQYWIEVTSRADASVLATANPRVVLTVHPAVWEERNGSLGPSPR